MANPQLPISPEGPQLPGGAVQTEAVQIQHLRLPPGEGSCHVKDGHTLFVNLSPRPIHYLQSQDGKTHTGLYRQGDFTLTPADMRFFARWQGTENCLEIQLKAPFLRSVAQDTLAVSGDGFSLLPTFQSRDPQIATLTPLLLTELQQNQPGGTLYIDSLTNLLAVQLLRHHGSRQTQLRTYEGGLPPHQLSRVLDYIDAHLTQDITLAELAQLLAMSPFHFGRMFKQSMGISPHQYVIQQRVERAKQLLKQTQQPIIEVALECGFNSHSHLSRQFRQLTGLTPKAFRMG